MVVETGFKAFQTDLGQALRMAWWSYLHRIDAEMESAGYPERSYPINYVFALYAQPGPMTISEMSRQFTISRQAASKIVAALREREYVTVTASTTDQREKIVELTPKAIDHVTARLEAASALDRDVRARIGDEGLAELCRLLDQVCQAAIGEAGADPINRYRSPKLW
ncbi:MarR family winged helix-turn-helix transcriptional regulator [Mycobacterium bourgelatii]|uniref:HTH marR-type domain-containing protein n=1 Tax=Mycobacterium bourgelatii TaxID=1273442 RepID=A0A7I9YVM9_MYCBU|nr:MarR family transcriptional regulator [Mycobacterium bourgelatii]MCV6976239.1 MarR family transcriptional regulator [Mycobacterium bourgelatii]GFG92627.1 hypothetical protein MBOU_46690 [Mycobacterium bourgelatii]